MHTERWSVRIASVMLAGVALAGQEGLVQEKRLEEGQRNEILALIKAVDDAAAGRGTAAMAPRVWETHVLEGAGGAAYVPMTVSLDPPAAAFPAAAVYVRVVSRGPGTVAEKSGLREWLAADALRGMPRPPAMQGFMLINPEEMPVGGPAMTYGNSPGNAQLAQGSFTALALMSRENENAATKDKDRAETAEKAQAGTFVYPFEDFDFLNLATMGAPADRRIRRAVAVPPGDYDVYLAVRERADRGSAPRVIVYKHDINLPPFPEGLATSSVILASSMRSLTLPYPPSLQSAHPYALGWTEMTPSLDGKFSDQQNLGVAFQVLNPVPDQSRKPDVTVEYNFHRKTGDIETLSTTARQDHNKSTLPPEFDLVAGHQLLAAQEIPLRTFAPGDYRLEVKVTDRKAAKTVSTSVMFSVVASARSLWVGKTVSGLLAPSFRREDVLSSDAVSFALDRLTDLSGPSVAPPVQAAMDSARSGQYAALLTQVPAIEHDELASTFLRGLGLMALNGSLEAAAVQFRDALRVSSDFLPSAMYLGACFAAGGHDREAIAAWQVALADEASTPILHILVADAYLRLKDTPQALDILGEASERWPSDDRVTKRLATAHLIANEPAEAMKILDPYLERNPGDLDAMFLAIQSLHEAGSEQPGSADADANARFVNYGRAYVAAGGTYRVVVEQWLNESAKQRP